jgi:EAL and modified HD-GYP domain-containing signal transduction protein
VSIAHPAGVTGLRSTVHRQPVLAVDDRVVGYTVSVVLDLPAGEVVAPEHAEAVGGPALASALHEQYLALDLPSLVADRFAFLPATREMLDGMLPPVHAPGRLVLDLPLGVEQWPDATLRVSSLRALGVELALGDLRGTPSQVALLPHLGFAMLDPEALGDGLEQLVRTAHASGCQVLAAGPVDEATRARCIAAGVDGFRGTAPGRASEANQTKVLRPAQVQCLAALHLLQQPEVELSAVAQVIDTDPVLTLRVLHLVNSGAFAIRNQVDTVQRAVVLLGVREVTALVAGLALDSRPGAMDSLWHILARALTCETVADDPAAYTAGMLSALIEELGVPADVVLDKVGVSATVADAVRDQSGYLGAVLLAVLAHEQRNPLAVAAAGFVPADVSDTYLHCLADALETARAVEA